MHTQALYSEIQPGHKPLKISLIKLSMFAIGRAWQTLYRFDSRLQREVANWPDGYRVMFTVRPHGPQFTMGKGPQGTLQYLGGHDHETDADLIVYFKNVESAFMVFTAQMGIPQAYAEHRISVKGDLVLSMSVVRSTNIVNTYLFPNLIAQRTIKRPAPIPRIKKHIYRLWIYLVGIPFGL